MKGKNKIFVVSKECTEPFRLLAEWTGDERDTIITENDSGEEINLLKTEGIAEQVVKCSVVIGGIKYPVSLPDIKNISLNIRPVPGNGLAVMAADKPVLHLARHESDLRQFPGDVRSLVLMRPENFSQLEKFSELENLFIHEYDQPELKGMPAGLPVMHLKLNRCEPLKNVKHIRQWLQLKEKYIVTGKQIGRAHV